MDVAIVKYNAGNIYSVVNAMRRLGIEPVLTDNAERLAKADRVLFPGQGQAREAMDYLKAHHLDQVIKDLRQPVLGICVGQQLLCRHSEEGDVDCIGIFDADVKRFRPERHEDKVPAMGWNQLHDLKTDLYRGMGNHNLTEEEGQRPTKIKPRMPTSCTATTCRYVSRPSLRHTTYCPTAHRSAKTTFTPASSIPKRVGR